MQVKFKFRIGPAELELAADALSGVLDTQNGAHISQSGILKLETAIGSFGAGVSRNPETLQDNPKWEVFGGFARGPFTATANQDFEISFGAALVLGAEVTWNVSETFRDVRDFLFD